MIEKKQRWALHADALAQPAGAGVTRRVLAYTDGLMCVENTCGCDPPSTGLYRWPDVCGEHL